MTENSPKLGKPKSKLDSVEASLSPEAIEESEEVDSGSDQSEQSEAESGADQEELTPSYLNNQIIALRPVVESAKVRLSKKLIKDANDLKKKHTKLDDLKVKNERLSERYIEELHALKKLKRDQISKFALVNTIDRNTLIKTSKDAAERALHKCATESVVLSFVNNLRAKHKDWRRVPFMLQRLGLQYKHNEVLSSANAESSDIDTDTPPPVKKPKRMSLPTMPKSISVKQSPTVPSKANQSARRSSISSSVVTKLSLSQLQDAGAEEIVIQPTSNIQKSKIPIKKKSVKKKKTLAEEDPFFAPFGVESNMKNEVGVGNEQTEAPQDGLNRRKRRKGVEPVFGVKAASKKAGPMKPDSSNLEPILKSDSMPQNELQSKEPTFVSQVHPSWAAQRKQRDLLNAKPQGKRTVFED